jgi:hypothetical protein
VKVSEIRVTGTKGEVILIQPKSVQVIRGGKAFFVDEKMAAQIFKAVANPCEKFCSAVEELKA